MPICLICDDTGLTNSDSTHPEFCRYCAAGKQARRAWEASKTANSTQGGSRPGQPRPASYIDIAELDNVNASVDAMRASLLGAAADEKQVEAAVKPGVVNLLYQVAHAGHEVSVGEATQLYDLAKALEGFLGALTPLGRPKK